MQAVVQNLHLEILLSQERRVVCFKRTSARITDLSAAEANYQQALEILELLPRAQYGLLLDIRSAPIRNDPTFEGFVSKFRARMFSGFAKTAILVKTAVGELQMNRLGREQTAAFGEHRRVFRDEQEALAFLDAKQEPTPSP